jgi:predicted alpha/beta hydrolase family esterase
VRHPEFVFLAGIRNSEPEHWQRHWYRSRADALWVEHDDWECVSRDRWVAELDATVASRRKPTVLIGHSLGCLLAAEWLREHPTSAVVGAFLVAPPDVSAAGFPCSVLGFRPPEASRLGTLPCPAMVVASTSDPYASIEYARTVACHWGAALVDVGDRGHINLASGLSDWPEGKTLFERFVGSLESG